MSRLYAAYSREVRTMKGFCIWFVCAVTVAAALLIAVTPVHAADASIYPGDTIRITVLGEPDLTRQILVDAAGSISLPLLKDPIIVGGKTAAAAADEITTALKQYLKRPQVTVEVAVPAKRNVAISGAIKTPGLYPIGPNTRLVDLLSISGGNLPNADLARIGVTRGETRQTLTCNLQEFYTGRNPDANIVLMDGDSINVPQLGTVIVTGQVRNQGPIMMSTNISVRQALERAGGLTEQADKTKVLVKKANETTWTTLDMVKVLQGDPGADIPLKDGDEVDVPAITQMGMFNITTGVRNPGSYPITGDKFYITDAISAAGGQSDRARLSRVTILRDNKSIPVDVGSIYAGKNPNVAVLPNDSISIGEQDPRKDPVRFVGTAALILRTIFGGW